MLHVFERKVLTFVALVSTVFCFFASALITFGSGHDTQRIKIKHGIQHVEATTLNVKMTKLGRGRTQNRTEQNRTERNGT